MAKVVQDLKSDAIAGFSWLELRSASSKAFHYCNGYKRSGDVAREIAIRLLKKTYLELGKNLEPVCSWQKGDLKILRDLISRHERKISIREFYQLTKSHSEAIISQWEQDKQLVPQIRELLIEKGFAECDQYGNLYETQAFSLLMKQKPLSPLSLKKACDKLADALEKVIEFNKDEKNLYPVELIVLYGSTARQENEIGDIDLHIQVQKRDKGKSYEDFKRADTMSVLERYPSKVGELYNFFLSSSDWAEKLVKKTSPYFDVDNSISIKDLLENEGLIVFAAQPEGTTYLTVTDEVLKNASFNVRMLANKSGSKKLAKLSVT